MTKSRIHSKSRRQRGFTLVETLVTVVLMVIVIGIAADGLIQMQKRSTADTGKVDMTQMARQFMDQIINDLHQTGYPGAKLYQPPPPPTANNVAVGLVSVDENAVEFEADIDGSGNVSHVYLRLLDANGNQVASGTPSTACPCTLQRGTIYKALIGSEAVPYYTEVTNVTNTGIFSAYFFDGSTVTPLPAAPADLPNIKDIKVTVNLQSTAPEMDGSFPTITMASEAKINN